MNPDILVSIVIPVFNVENYLVECLESVLSQSYSNCEILLIDDGSTDRSGAICDQYAALHTSVRSYHKSNGGLSDARNFGVSRSLGAYIAFVDGDDLIAPSYIETLLVATETSGCDIAAFDFCTPFIDGDRVPLRGYCDISNDLAYQVLSAKEYIDGLLRHFFDTGACCRIYSRQLLVNHPFPFGMVFEDAAVIYQMVHDIESVAIVPGQGLYAYRQRSGSIVHSMASEAMVESAIKIGRQVESDIRRWYGESDEAYASCGFSINRLVLLKTTSRDTAIQNRLWTEIRHYRHKLLLDRDAKLTKRLAALFSYFGLKPFLFMSSCVEILINRG